MSDPHQPGIGSDGDDSARGGARKPGRETGGSPGQEPNQEPSLESSLAAANEAFYTAFETGDLDAMNEIWLDHPGSCCVHPGALPVRGAGAISRSWAVIMANTPYIQFFLTDVQVSLRGDVGYVTCTENVLTADSGPGSAPGGGEAAGPAATGAVDPVEGGPGRRGPSGSAHGAGPEPGPAPDEVGFTGAKALASNVFVRTEDTWRLWIHHASPVLSGGDGGD